MNGRKCSECQFADAYGRGCKHGLMFPVQVFLTGEPCLKWESKTIGQLQEQLELIQARKGGAQ